MKKVFIIIILITYSSFQIYAANVHIDEKNAQSSAEASSAVIIYHTDEISLGPETGKNSTKNASFGWVNDNLTNISNLPLDGKYGGPDDKYTFAAFFHYNEDKWKILLNYHVITDRLYYHRYDYLYCMFLREFKRGNILYTAGGGLDCTGNIGGEFLQNAFHSYIGVDNLNIPYKEYDPGFTARGDIEYSPVSLMNDNLKLNIYASLKFSTTRVGDSFKLGLPFYLITEPFKVQIFTGYDYKFSFAEECVSGNSFFYKTAFSIPIMKDMLFTAGFSRNIIYSCPGSDNLAEYNKFTKTIDENRDIVVLPQYFFVFSYGEKYPDIKDMPLP